MESFYNNVTSSLFNVWQSQEHWKALGGKSNEENSIFLISFSCLKMSVICMQLLYICVVIVITIIITINSNINININNNNNYY